MKNILSQITSLLLLISLCYCSGTKVATYPVETVALPNAEDGTIVIRSSGQGENKPSAVENAEKKAFNTLLFYGYPSSVQTRPMVENESAAKNANSGFFNEFFDNKGYSNFIVSSLDEGSDKRVGKYIYLKRVIKINLRSLRTYLENKGIVRKFGY